MSTVPGLGNTVRKDSATLSPARLISADMEARGDIEDVTVVQLAQYLSDFGSAEVDVKPVDVGAGTGLVKVQKPAPAQVAAPTVHVPVTAGRTCVCGHAKQAHQHYRAGTDCALCACQRLKRSFAGRLFFRSS